jgi:hypothetical protein
LFAALLALECFFLPETLFPRELVLASEERHQTRDKEEVYTEANEVKRTKELGYLVRAGTPFPHNHMLISLQSFCKIPGVTHPKPWDTILRATQIFAYPTVVISVFSFVFFQYWWYVTFPSSPLPTHPRYPRL